MILRKIKSIEDFLDEDIENVKDMYDRYNLQLNDVNQIMNEKFNQKLEYYSYDLKVDEQPKVSNLKMEKKVHHRNMKFQTYE